MSPCFSFFVLQLMPSLSNFLEEERSDISCLTGSGMIGMVVQMCLSSEPPLTVAKLGHHIIVGFYNDP